MWINQAGSLVVDSDAYTAPDGTHYPAAFPKAEIPGLSPYTPSQNDLDAQLEASKAIALRQIDADTDAIYGAVLGNRAEEYTLAANEAQAYKNAGYAGNAPGSVQSWATAKGWTATQAADDILATAAQWVGAQATIRAARLARKEQVRNAASLAGVASAYAAWAAYAAAIRSQLGLNG